MWLSLWVSVPDLSTHVSSYCSAFARGTFVFFVRKSFFLLHIFVDYNILSRRKTNVWIHSFQMTTAKAINSQKIKKPIPLIKMKKKVSKEIKFKRKALLVPECPLRPIIILKSARYIEFEKRWGELYAESNVGKYSSPASNFLLRSWWSSLFAWPDPMLLFFSLSGSLSRGPILIVFPTRRTFRTPAFLLQ